MAADPDSEDCFDVARKWIQECRSSEGHTFCKGRRDANVNSVLPTRLVDVGNLDGSQEPRLVLSSDLEKRSSIEYAALSHCWGGTKFAQIAPPTSDSSPTAAPITVRHDDSGYVHTAAKPLTTISTNISDRVSSIPMEILPPTFRDAVKITRALRLQYIWIDSLCIIQDSKVDWEQEGAQMANIYKNSHVTLAAESSRDSQGGILKPRMLDFSPVEIPLVSKGRDISTTMFVRPALDSWEDTVTGDKSMLCSRAWVLQESLLAPKTIHFGAQQMMWECRSVSIAEGDVKPIPPNKRERDWSWSRNKRFLAEIETIATDGPETAGLVGSDILYLQWYSILRDYTNRKMTFSSDVFPALVGLATEFNRRLNDRYVAGLWEKDLHRGLLWKIEDSERAAPAIPFRAPTWSWASMVGQILPMNDCRHLVHGYKSDVLEVQTEPVSYAVPSRDENWYGEIKNGILRLRGRWRSTSAWPKFEEDYFDIHIIPGVEENLGVMFRYFDCGTEERYLERHQNGRKLSLLLIAGWRANLGDIPQWHFLILESGNNGDEGVFRRVGVVEIHNAAAAEEWAEEWEIREVLVI